MNEDELYEKAAKRADKKISFNKHLYGFIVGNLFLFIINVVFSPGSWWFYWITLLSGIALLFEFLKTFVFSEKLGDDRDAMIENEMEKLKK